MRKYTREELKPVAFGFAVPVLAAVFISVSARAPRAVQSAELMPLEETSAAVVKPTAQAAGGLERDYLTSPAALKASRFAQTLRTESSIAVKNPFIYATDQDNSKLPVPENRQPTEPTLEIPVFRLTAIMSGRRQVAVINGNLFQEGQQVAEGWTVSKINNEKRTVLMVGPAGNEVLLYSE